MLGFYWRYSLSLQWFCMNFASLSLNPTTTALHLDHLVLEAINKPCALIGY
jgi:hypothetical protein